MSKAKTFDSLKSQFHEGILETIRDLGFSTMTPVQAAVIPLFLSNKDVNVEACTGSGKTLAFLIPVIEIILRHQESLTGGHIGGVIISPTRELASQTYNVAKNFMKYIDSIQLLLYTGGTDVKEDIKNLDETEHIKLVIATPGRLLDIIHRKEKDLKIKNMDILILDEADELLDLGHGDAVKEILTYLPKQRRTGLFSATEASSVESLSQVGLRNPVNVKLEIKRKDGNLQAVPLTLQNEYIICENDEKIQLYKFFNDHPQMKIIVFFLTCASVDYYNLAFQHINPNKLLILNLHGRMIQKRREKTMEKFRNADHGILLCTDLAARGIDIPDVDYIIQFTPPQDPSFFIHRIGRTARAGRRGQSLLLLCPSEAAYLPFIQKRGVPLTEYNDHETNEERHEHSMKLLETIKEHVRHEREIMEAGRIAFVADIRGYRNHDCNFILRFEDWNIAALARAYCLLKLPKTSELRNKTIDFVEEDIDLSTIPYTDKTREEQRLVREQKEKEQRELKKKQALENNTKQNKPKKRPNQEEQQTKRVRKGKHERIMDEWEELQEEELLYNKLRKKKITQKEYDEHLLKSFRQTSDDENDSESQIQKFKNEHQTRKNIRKMNSKKSKKSKKFNKH